MRRIIGVLAAAALLLSACGDKNKVGDESLLNFKDQTQQRLGATTTTAPTATTAPPTTVAGGKAGVGATTTAPARATTTTAAVTFDIAINSDQGGSSQFDPPSARVFVGTVVRWVNKDTVNRSVEADGGRFASPPIPPGGTYTYRVSTAGQINYHDGTRPYAVASLEVVNR
ncbi:MAG TPA: hypothetical protein VM938_12445 [Acidimicrobiales bacterium]|nr:hypothetical protein [Acidimicrobiales bacterium]